MTPNCPTDSYNPYVQENDMAKQYISAWELQKKLKLSDEEFNKLCKNPLFPAIRYPNNQKMFLRKEIINYFNKEKIK